LLGDTDTLNALATDVGVGDADKLWQSDDLADDVRADEDQANELGITGVPTMLFDDKFMVVGAQGSERILDVLTRAWTRR
jgi:predicted DsbA family dithiol-disulfide isomerase